MSAQAGLRERAARGTVVNAAFLVAVNSLALIKAFLVAGFVDPGDYGVWSILLVGLGTLVGLKQVGFVDKYVQQEEADQSAAFQKAFTLELLGGVLFLAVMLAVLPLLALAYGQWEILAPGAVYALSVPAVSLQSPAWIHYRRMDFLRQRLVLSVDPLVSFVVTVALAAAGLGYWALVIGLVVGSLAGAAVALVTCPLPLGLRYESGTMREYVSFSWPLLAAASGAVLMAQLSIFVGEAALGLAGAGAILLALSAGIFADKVDQILTQTLYPVVCAVRDRRDLLLESFAKSNRLAMMWGVPFGVGLALFAPALVEFGIGEKWEPAVGLMQAIGLMAAINQIGFNWTAYYRALGRTRPIGVAGLITLAAFLCTAVPLLATEGLDGLALGMGVTTLVSLACRWYFLLELFPGFPLLLHATRAAAPTAVAAAAVLLVRASGDGGATLAATELAVYLVVLTMLTALLERALLREVRGYLGLERGAILRA